MLWDLHLVFFWHLKIWILFSESIKLTTKYWLQHFTKYVIPQSSINFTGKSSTSSVCKSRMHPLTSLLSTFRYRKNNLSSALIIEYTFNKLQIKWLIFFAIFQLRCSFYHCLPELVGPESKRYYHFDSKL